jgi:hypothetical protein
MNSLYRWLFHYYIALTLSAGAVAPMIGSTPLGAPAPIVRRYVQPGANLWDPRESVVVHHGRLAIVTAPMDRQQRYSGTIIQQNWTGIGPLMEFASWWHADDRVVRW